VNSIRFSKNNGFCDNSIHAENQLVNKLGDKAKNIKVFVYRFNWADQDGTLEARPSLPCMCCQHILKKAQVARVFAVNANNKVEMIKHENLAYFQAKPYEIVKHAKGPTLKKVLSERAMVNL
jgi:hypothetical protein